MDKERCRQIDIYQLDFKLLGKEVIGKVECLPDIPQEVVKNEIVVAGGQNDVVEQIGHSDEIGYSQNKPYTYNSEQHPAQFIQVIPKSQFFNFCHCTRKAVEVYFQSVFNTVKREAVSCVLWVDARNGNQTGYQLSFFSLFSGSSISSFALFISSES